MDKKDYSQLCEVIKEQEELLRFQSFSNKDAWNLGAYITEKLYERQITLAVQICRMNGAVLFQHLMEGTTKDNQRWMQRKFNTVSLTEGSSLRAWAMLGEKDETVASRGLSEQDYAFCGGGFPIRLKSGELVGVAIVSNLPHMKDHQVLVDLIAEWLGVKDVPGVE